LKLTPTAAEGCHRRGWQPFLFISSDLLVHMQLQRIAIAILKLGQGWHEWLDSLKVLIINE